jgi:hypothetical protein
MNRARFYSWLFGVFLLAFLGSRPLWAVSPGYIMIYGDGLQKPIVVEVTTADIPAYEFLWDTIDDECLCFRTQNRGNRRALAPRAGTACGGFEGSTNISNAT